VGQAMGTSSKKKKLGPTKTPTAPVGPRKTPTEKVEAQATRKADKAVSEQVLY